MLCGATLVFGARTKFETHMLVMPPTAIETTFGFTPRTSPSDKGKRPRLHTVGPPFSSGLATKIHSCVWPMSTSASDTNEAGWFVEPVWDFCGLPCGQRLLPMLSAGGSLKLSLTSGMVVKSPPPRSAGMWK